jgi:4-diphosphocytidyl-2-C-methyl-D-erythritol kinase
VRAAERLLEIAGLSCSVRIRLTKRIPAAAGLGGASSDAGAVLRSLTEIFPDALSPDALASLALDLGADVPFFLDPKPALVRGIGERVEALPEAPALTLMVAHPGVPLSTAQVYRAFDALGPTPAPGAPRRPSLRPLSRLRRDGAPDPALARLLENDLEPAAVRLCPPIARLREAIRAAGALAVGMSGSGPTVYGLFGDAAAAASALGRPAFESPIWARVAVTEESR